MRRRSRLNGLRHRLRWKLRVARSNLEVAYEDAKDWLIYWWGTPAVHEHPFHGCPVSSRGQRLELHVDEGRISRAATAYLVAVEAIAAEERRLTRRVSA